MDFEFRVLKRLCQRQVRHPGLAVGFSWLELDKVTGVIFRYGRVIDLGFLTNASSAILRTVNDALGVSVLVLDHALTVEDLVAVRTTTTQKRGDDFDFVDRLRVEVCSQLKRCSRLFSFLISADAAELDTRMTSFTGVDIDLYNVTRSFMTRFEVSPYSLANLRSDVTLDNEESLSIEDQMKLLSCLPCRVECVLVPTPRKVRAPPPQQQ